MAKRWLILGLLACIVAIPLVLQERVAVLIPQCPDDVLIVISPHTEFVCDEFGSAFRHWYQQRTGRTVVIDWRHAGGISETLRYLGTVYDNAFRLYWEQTLGKPWTQEIASSFSRPIELPLNASNDTPAEAARRVFFNSNIGCGIDVLFGGGTLAFKILETKGFLTPSTLPEKHPEWFTEKSFPLTWGGDFIRDPQNRWFGAVFSSYGIVYNTDALSSIGYHKIPTRWTDLTHPSFIGEVALCDPSQAGSAKKSFELIIQEQMLLQAQKAAQTGASEQQAIRTGWIKGLQVIQKLCANARYLTDKSTKPIMDVAAGDCAVGMAPDQYGLCQQANIAERQGSDRFGYITPSAGSAIEADPIGILRGAPHPEVAEAFLEFVLSEEGQKLWAFRAGTPGGPEHYALMRAPVRREIYERPQYAPYLSASLWKPYENPEGFIYHPQWTQPIYPPLHIIIKAAFIDPQPELRAAWQAILQAQAEGRSAQAAKAMAILENMQGLDYDSAAGPLKEALVGGCAIETVRTQSALTRRFIAQYAQAQQVAQQKS
ncbi:MAG: hypothetical protein B7X06_00440 [Verrucomicrobia bacterium 21-51-4]|nr:MAG: hypothetical protein B7X06_00440 [Verrucomicrobia bacterium 21-51-4]HQU08572.1 extracellular solute-binding protein [Opitutales bacterium]